ncbi:MAG: PAS domain S-box protein [Nitrospirota bacterium]|nr:PAS domain S-box protein [Nitrospirota bacterium]
MLSKEFDAQDGNSRQAYRLLFERSQDRKRMEQDLRLFNEIVTNMAEGVVLTRTSDGTIVYANPTFNRLFGYGPGELDGRNVSVLNAPGTEDSAEVAGRIQEELARTGVWKGVIRNARKDGTIFWCDASVSTLEHHRYGNVWIGVHQDITARVLAEEEYHRLNRELEDRVRIRTAELEKANQTIVAALENRKEMEAELRREKSKLEGVIAAIGDGLSIQDRDFTILFQNNAQRAFIGDHVGEKCHAAYEGKDRVCDGCPMQRSFLDGAVHSAERRAVINGEERFFDVTASPVRSADGSMMAGIEIVREVTEKRRAMQAMRESEQRFRSLFETMKDGVCVAGIDGRIIMTNPAMRAMLGRSEEEVGGMDMRQIHPQDALPLVRAEFEAHARRERHFTRDIPVMRKDGSVWYADVTTAWLTIDGVPHMGGIFHDVTERREHVRQLTDALQQKEILLREVYHRVKNNLQVVASMLYLQSGTLEDPEALRTFLESRDRVMAMSLVHEQLYRSENFAQIDFSGYLRRLVVSLSQTHETACRSVEMIVTTGDLPHLSIDQAVPCGLIVNELVQNAMKHAFPSGRRGKVVVEAAGRTDGLIEFSVSDDGAGFSALPTDRSLGMQLVQSLVRQLGGVLEAKNKGGARFVVRFPAVAAQRSI